MNNDIKEMRGSISWAMVADRMGISESTLFYHLRKRLSEEKRNEIIEAIESIKREG